MKKFLKFFIIILSSFAFLLFIIPLLFQNQIKTFAINEVNKQLNAKVYVGDFSLNLFKHFPNATVSVGDFGVVGVDSFKKDTLARAKAFSVVLNLHGLLSGQYEINKVSLDDATIHGIVLKDGSVNWDIVKPDTTTTSTKDTSKSSSFHLALNSFTLNRVNVVYNDYQQNRTAQLDTLNLSLKGDLSSSDNSFANIHALTVSAKQIAYKDSTIDTDVNNFAFDMNGSVDSDSLLMQSNLKISAISLSMSNVPYLSKAAIESSIDINANLKTNKYTFGQNHIRVNDLLANFSGYVQQVDSSVIDMDVKLNTPNLNLKEILSLIPSIYSNNFSALKAEGNVGFSAWAKGKYTEDIYPAFCAKLSVSKGKFFYPGMPKQVNDISILAEVSNPGGSLDNSVVNVKNFSLVMANNPFLARLLLKTPISDPDFDAYIKGIVDLGSIKDIMKIDGVKFSGIINADVSAQGKLSYVEKSLYDKFVVKGNLNIKNVNIVSSSIPGNNLEVKSANLDFSNKYLSLTDLQMLIGKNDIQATGKLQNFLPYILADETIKGNLSVKSNYLNVNDFIDIDTTTTANNTQTASSSENISLPSNIDFTFIGSVRKLLYSTIVVENIKTSMSIKNQVASINSLSGKTMDGSFDVTGDFNTQNKDVSKANLAFNVKQMSIPKVFTQVYTARKFAPVLSKAKGSFNMKLNMSANMLPDLSPVLSSINANGKFSTKSVGLSGVKVLSELSSKLNYSSLANPTLKNVSIPFEIKNGRMYTSPFAVKVSSANMNVSGSSGLDETLDYMAKISIPNQVSAKTNIPLSANAVIGGTFTSPKIKLDASSLASTVKDTVKKVVKAAVKKTVSKAIEQAKAQQQKIMSVANQQASKIKEQAKLSGDKIVEQAQTQADKLVSEAKNPIEKAARKKVAAKMVSEAKAKSDKLNSEAETKSNKIISDAQSKSDALIKSVEAKNN